MVLAWSSAFKFGTQLRLFQNMSFYQPKVIGAPNSLEHRIFIGKIHFYLDPNIL